MTKDDKKAWETKWCPGKGWHNVPISEQHLAWQKFRSGIENELNRDTIEKTSAAVSDTHIGFIAGFKAGRDGKGDDWVPIADIPEEWKDGRWVWVARFSEGTYNGVVSRTKWTKKEQEHNWQYNFNKTYWPATHARLPPQLPQDRKEG